MYGPWPTQIIFTNICRHRVPDIMRHMSNLIVRAEKEVILATNYWQNSVASKYITNAMKELSRRAGERGEKIVFKLEYDRGSPKQLLEPHYIVPEKEYLGKAVALPHPDEIPNLDLQVMNYHRPLFGTFHCKYMVVDRKYAVLQSNNIQDNDNLEMMIHLEGPIVDSLYDMALISWHKKLEPALPSHNSPAVQGGIGSFGEKSYETIFSREGSIKGHSAVVHPDKMRQQEAYSYEPRAINQPGAIQPHTSNDILTGPSTDESVSGSMEVSQEPQTDSSQKLGQTQNIGQEVPESAHHAFTSEELSKTERLRENATAAATTGDIEHIAHTKRGDEPAGHGSAYQGVAGSTSRTQRGPDSKTQEFLSSGDPSLPESRIEHPSPANALPEHTADDPHYDVDIAGEIARVQTAVSPKQGETRVQAVTRHLNHTRNVDFKGNAPECAPHEEMTPYIPHPVHEPFPIAMVCREPYGAATHNSVYNPQNEVWLSALRNAKKNVFIQSPTLNAEPLVPAIMEACERGIDVYCYICLGYNDTVGHLLYYLWKYADNYRASCFRCKAVPMK
jgi:phosphatidylserine/phosphatidylglycerophosphate/cardiolipin synthase-like enzyme